MRGEFNSNLRGRHVNSPTTNRGSPASTYGAGTLRAYGSVILSFVGALHCGFAMLMDRITARKRNAASVWSVVPKEVRADVEGQ